jgi:predicted PurR-regulated permease PerM
MGLSGQKIEVTPPAEVPEEMPLPSDPKAIFLGGLFFLALMAAAYVAREVILPLVFAIVLSLLLQPALRFLERLRLPRTLASLLLILALLGTIVGLGTAVSGPARSWAGKTMAKKGSDPVKFKSRGSTARRVVPVLTSYFRENRWTPNDSDRHLELLAGAEGDFFARLDLDRLAGRRIATHASGAFAHL